MFAFASAMHSAFTCSIAVSTTSYSRNALSSNLAYASSFVRAADSSSVEREDRKVKVWGGGGNLTNPLLVFVVVSNGVVVLSPLPAILCCCWYGDALLVLVILGGVLEGVGRLGGDPP